MSDRRWLREDALNISMASGEICNAVSTVISPISTDRATPADIFAVLILSAEIDGWNWRRALVDGQDIAIEVARRMTA
jgi:hypothetical protein